MNVGAITEYKDMSKDGTGAFRKALKGHKGQFIYIDANGKPKVRPVYAFESIQKVREELIQRTGRTSIKGFFQSGCLVEINAPVSHPSTPLAPGKYKLNTIMTDGRAKLTNSSGNAALPISLEKLLAAGLKRVEERS
jgi:hypothetical protein